MKLIDMHTHSSMSDGTHSPSELVKEAYSRGVSVLSLTDHDTVSGCKEAAQECNRLGIRFIPGVEISGKENKKLHLLGYGFDPTDPELNETLDMVAEERRKCAEKICLALERMGLEIYYDEVLECVNGKSVGKPHIAEVMINKGYVSSTEEAFVKYLDLPEIKAIKKMKLAAADAIRLIHKTGGLVVLAHPYQLKMESDRIHSFIRELAEMGLDGIECYYTKHTPEMMMEYLHLAEKLGLYTTIGSDFHGQLRKPGVLPGTGAENSLLKLRSIREFDESILNRLL